MKSVCLYPGGFKPPHAGHLYVANSLAKECIELNVFIGQKDRDGITQELSYTIWNLFPLRDNIKIIKSVNKTPLIDAYDYVFNLKEEAYVALITSNKENDKRNILFSENVEKYKSTPTKDGKYIYEGVKPKTILNICPLLYSDRTDYLNDQPISSTVLRNDLNNNDYINFKTNYIGLNENIIQKIYLLLKSQ